MPRAGHFLLLVLLGALTAPAGARGTDRPIGAVKLVLQRSAGKQKLVFVSRDHRFLFPAPGGPDDPMARGALVELFSPVEPGGAALVMPPGAGKPGWAGRRGVFRFVNAPAPDTSPVKLAVLKRGTMLKLVARATGLALAGPQGAVGIRVTVGSARSCAHFDGSTVARDRAGRFVGKGARAARLPDCSDASLGAGTIPAGSTTTTTLGTGCASQETFATIQERIFSGRGCDVSTCHGSFASSNLDLRPGAAYVQLVDVPVTAPGAPAGKKRVLPGHSAASFLSQKLHGTFSPGEGGPMPAVGTPLSQAELALIDAWIDAGAPPVGTAGGAPCLPVPTYEPAPALAPPPGGYQIVLTGPTLLPGQEQEGCYWIPAPNPTDFPVGKWEFSLNPGTHHFAIFEYNQPGAPTTGVWQVDNAGCFMGAQFGNNITGSPQAPYYVDTYPPGVARVMRAGSYLGLNAHYYNQFDVPIEVKVWINAHPYGGTPAHEARTIIALNDTFTIDVAPFTVQVHPAPGHRRARYTNNTAVPQSIISLSGHMHYRGLRFTIWDAGGAKLWENFDWSHPFGRFFAPSLVLNPGDYFEYECLYDNGVSRPVRLDGVGNPAHLLFGVSAEDAMCILTGQYYQ
jgi:hypothetical protein